METISLEVTNRDTSIRRGALNKMRAAGNLPGVVYGTKVGSVPISVSKKQLDNILSSHGANAIITLLVNGQTIQAMIKELQKHPVTGLYWHVDFSQISMDKKIKAEIQVHFEGEPEGIKEGGILQYGETSVEVECLPGEIPERFTLDISILNIGDKLTVADLEEVDNVKILAEPEQVLISVLQPAMEEEDTEEQEEATTEVPTLEESKAGTEE